MAHDPRKEAFVPYVRQLAESMALKDWNIRLDPCDLARDGAEASIWLANTQRLAIVYLSEHFLGCKPEEQRKTLVHELIHCHVEMMRMTMNKLVTEEKDRDIILFQVEYAVDSLADAFAPHMPLPNIATD